MTSSDEILVDGEPYGAAHDGWRARVLEFLDDHVAEVVDSLTRYVRIPSISGSAEENEIQDVLAAELSGCGLEVDHWEIPLGATAALPGFPGVEVERDEAWGVVAAVRGSGGGSSLMLNAHVDVVPPGDPGAWGTQDPFGAHVRGDAVHGRGTCDMKGGLVAALWAVRAVVATGVRLRGDLLLAAVQGEEDGGLGTFAMLDRGWRADACIIPEPTSLDLVPANAGALTFRLTVRGLAAHASRRNSGVSAVEKFWLVFQALRRLEARRNAAADPLMARWDMAYPLEIGMLTAGDWSSSVPDALTATGRYGVALDEAPGVARRQFEDAVDQACAEDPWLRAHPVEVQWWGGQFAAGRTTSHSPIIDTVRRAHSAVSPHTQETWGAPYGSDLRLMTQIGGVPTVHYGPGDACTAHGPGELVPIPEVLTTARTLALAAIDHCGTG